MRSACALTVLVGLVVGIAYAQPAWVADLGLDVWKLPEWNLILDKQNSRSEKLDQDLNKFWELTQRKDQLIRDLANGTISLTEAVTTLTQLNEGDYLERAVSILNLERPNLNESVGRLLIFWVHEHLKNQPEMAEVVYTRLDEELEELETITQ